MADEQVQPTQITLDQATIEQLQAAAFRAIMARDAAQAELNTLVAELSKRAQGG